MLAKVRKAIKDIRLENRQVVISQLILYNVIYVLKP